MTMKKRFLGLALAAMVAVPATTAYANTATITGNDTETLSQNVTVSGTIRKGDGQAPEGRLDVELPTTMAFTVDEKSNFTGANYTVNNRSAVPIRLSVSEFRESNTNGGITLNEISSFDPSAKDRSNVAMSLDGNIDGQFTSVDLYQVDSNGEDVLDVKAGSSGVLTLNGEAGTKAAENQSTVDSNGAKEEFTLIFKIKKKA